MTTFRNKILLLCIFEFLPVLVFVVVFKHFGFVVATYLLMILVVISTLVLYLLEKKIPLFTLIVTAITGVFAGFSIVQNNPELFALRDTCYDYFFAVFILYGLVTKKDSLRRMFGQFIELPDRAWRDLSLMWLPYFIVVGTINEHVRRGGDITLWVQYKMYVILITVIIGALSGGLIYFTLRRKKTKNSVY